LNKFKEITGSSFYKPLDKGKPRGSNLAGSVFDSRNRDEKSTSSRIAASTGSNKRPASSTATAFAGNGRPPKQPKQSGPERARFVEDLPLEDIRDFHLRERVHRMRVILPYSTNLMCRNALLLKKGNFDDAMELLVSQEEHKEKSEVDLTVSEEEQPRERTSVPSMFTSKRQVKAPNRTIQDKWSSTQALPNLSQASPTTTPEKPRRKLVRGRKDPSSPVVKPIRSFPVQTIESGDDPDSGIEPEPEEDDELESKVLDFFNTCSIKDLADIANTTEDTAGVVLSQKPFASLEDVRQISSDIPATTKTGKRKAPKKTIGDKIVNICLEMWTGYEAVDALVTQCEALGKPLAKAMEGWGVDVFGTTKAGELELLSLSNTQDMKIDSPSVRDSGIGTPSDSALASGEEGDGDIKISTTSRISKVNKDIYVKQPSIMSKDTVLKDYQLVGLNWLVLLFEHKLSCILADEMGLGKTCQVISFLSHLLEHKDIRGPHLVVVPSSTLENWLREFRRFSPSLTVEPYYGVFLFI
jgi:SWI/SNF-related matrix-associated actin-dependent regulator 1 of chromatin subfamily A